MAQALIFVAPTVFGIGGSFALTTATGLTLAGIAVNIGGSLLLSQLIRPNVPDAAKPENIQVNSKNAVAPRVRHYGVVKAGGNVVFHRAKSGISYRVVVHGHGQISNVLQRYLNNELVQTDAQGFVTDSQYQFGGRSRVRMFGRTGLVPESHYTMIASIWPEWTPQHRLDGLWSTMILSESVPAEEYRAMYPNNEPALSVVAETTKCHDPRSGLTVFTENMALAIADYVASPDGFNRPNAFDSQDIADQADICDRDVALSAGGTEKLYRITGSYLLNEKPQNVLGRMLAACAGRIRLKPTGKVGLKVGAWTDPEFTLVYGDILEVQEVNSGPDVLERYNELPARFTSHDLGFIEVDAKPWLDETRVAEDGEVLPGPDKSLLMCPSHRQARQVMKIHTERDNPRQEITLLCKPKALPAIYEDTIALNVPQLGLIGNYEVTRHSASFEKGLLRSVGLTLRRIDAAAFTLSLAEQGSVQQLPEPDTSAGVPVPQNVTAAAAGIQSAVNVFVAGIGVAWQAPPSDALSPLLKVTKSGQANWQDVSVGAATTSVTVPGLIDGQQYDISLAFVTPGGMVGAAVMIQNVVASAVTEPPLPPTGLVVTDAGGGAALVEMTASTSASLWKTEIYRDAALVGVVYAGPGSAISFVDTSGAGTFDWTARSVNVSNVNSASDAGPVTATIA
ncbi:MAG: fibronectin type III domain-containing protein [Rhodobacteraceae bacterium]|nr:fibronectin type III domain-containing protein [Paracoccaceae bacterium]